MQPLAPQAFEAQPEFKTVGVCTAGAGINATAAPREPVPFTSPYRCTFRLTENGPDLSLITLLPDGTVVLPTVFSANELHSALTDQRRDPQMVLLAAAFGEIARLQGRVADLAARVAELTAATTASVKKGRAT